MQLQSTSLSKTSNLRLLLWSYSAASNIAIQIMCLTQGLLSTGHNRYLSPTITIFFFPLWNCMNIITMGLHESVILSLTLSCRQLLASTQLPFITPAGMRPSLSGDDVTFLESATSASLKSDAETFKDFVELMSIETGSVGSPLPSASYWAGVVLPKGDLQPVKPTAENSHIIRPPCHLAVRWGIAAISLKYKLHFTLLLTFEPTCCVTHLTTGLYCVQEVPAFIAAQFKDAWA